MGEFEFLNSCGDTQMLKIIRNGGNCDSTPNKMQCGRILAHSSPTVDDWTYTHVGENVGQKRWIALTSKMAEESVAGYAEESVGSSDNNEESKDCDDSSEAAVWDTMFAEENSVGSDDSKESKDSEESKDSSDESSEAVGQSN